MGDLIQIVGVVLVVAGMVALVSGFDALFGAAAGWCVAGVLAIVLGGLLVAEGERR